MKIAINRKFTNTGPMIFTKRLFDRLVDSHGVKVVDHKSRPDIYFAVISFKKNDVPKGSKSVIRIDGMYWNLEAGNIQRENRSIFSSIKQADGVVFQSQFCKKCYESNIGKVNKSKVILNAVDWDEINRTKPYNLPHTPGLVASAEWRPTKRAKSICDGFLKSNIPHHLYMIGKPPPNAIQSDRITWMGRLSSTESISVMKACTHAIHLGKFDPCPNSVVEQVCCGLPVLHTQNGGTPEIVRGNGISIPEDVGWDYRPLRGVNDISPDVTAPYLESLVKMEKCVPHDDLNISYAADKYYQFLCKVLSES